ncbi:amino acid adenylation domain-containing protein [Microbulbifer halophilus]|uniref:Amino acid adenylation domain-containing protein n=1 Tax=Microbulbifer halophilus TaxID=453963 RepID=A0ABW5EBJ4_9GAMM|nr:amino acid adenylation domain-containing protein [Microbulbifer halophilus]MCW8126028.1 amino acid adenylation domain-containing protein [Microbulbifer halophilus]
MEGNTVRKEQAGQSRPGGESDRIAIESSGPIHPRAGLSAPDSPENSASPKLLPLAFSQRGMWVGEKIGADDAIYNLAEYTEISGPLNAELFIAALRRVVVEAEVCRAQIIEDDAGPRQVVYPDYRGELPFIDFSGEADSRSAAGGWMMDDLSRPVDLARDPLWSSALLRVDNECHYWYQRCHHVVLDGFGGGLISRRVAEIYSVLAEDREPEPSPFFSLSVQLQRERAYRESARFRRDRDYWLEQMANLPEPVSLARRGVESVGGLRRSSARLSAADAEKLHQLGEAAGGSLPQILVSLLAAYIHRASGATDLVFNLPVTARTDRALRRIPGMMANAVPVRLAMSPQMILSELVRRAGRAVRGALRHQQYRHEDLRRDLGLLERGREIARLGVNIEPFDYDLRFGGNPSVTHNLSNGTVEDLALFVYDRGDDRGLHIDLDANPALYEQSELDAHRDRLLRLIRSLLADPRQSIGTVDLLAPSEWTLLERWNATDRPLPEQPWPVLFEQRAAASPASIAVQAGERELSYGELNARANRLCRALLARGVGAGDIVAVALPRDEWVPAALLAILKSGAAYLPLDPYNPPERLQTILREARPRLLLTAAAVADRLPGGDWESLHLERLPLQDFAADNPGAGDRRAPLRAQTPAYVIYTSGSTGRPKGVVIGHGGLANLLLAMADELKLTAADRLLAQTTLSFDVAALELFLPLLAGARVVMAGRDQARDPRALAALIRRSGATMLQATPSLWQALVAECGDELKGLRPLTGGEALSGKLARQLRRLGYPVVNLYGPTETTVLSTLMVLDGDDLDAPPIGRPIANTRLYVLDAAMQPLPPGEAGELYIGGAGVALGYLNRPDLTEERFPPNPFGDGYLYRTGDLVRQRPDGALEYLGRNDFQIKLRGFRIEAGEIEEQLVRCPGVDRAVVVLREDAPGGKCLMGYVLPERVDGEARAIDTELLRSRLRRTLPDYMVPAQFAILDRWPLNANGKLDRGALPAPGWQPRGAYTAPRSELEVKLADLWSGILDVETVGIHDSFFDLGGDSLSAARMLSRLREITGREISLGAVFESATIAELAQKLEQSQARDPLSVLLPLHGGGDPAPLFCIHPAAGLSWGYAALSRYLGERPLYGLQAAGLDGSGELPGSIEDMAADYLRRIRRVQPEGPYHLLGWSLGGLAAHEMARQLQAGGEEVAFLGMLDAYPFVQLGDRQRDEAQMVRAALAFLGFERGVLDASDCSMDALADFLWREYRVFDMPAVRELQRSNPDFVAGVRRVIENNLELVQRFVPGRVRGDLLFVQATRTAHSELLHHDPEHWRRHIDGRLRLQPVACHHQQVLETEPLARIGPLLADVLGERALCG